MYVAKLTQFVTMVAGSTATSTTAKMIINDPYTTLTTDSEKKTRKVLGISDDCKP